MKFYVVEADDCGVFGCERSKGRALCALRLRFGSLPQAKNHGATVTRIVLIKPLYESIRLILANAGGYAEESVQVWPLERKK